MFPEPLLRNHQVNCLNLDVLTQQPYNDKFCLFRAFRVHLQGKIDFETANSRFCNNFPEKFVRDAKQFRRVLMDYLPIVQDAVEKKNLFLRYRH